METQAEKTHTCGTICLKYLLFLFNILFWLAGGAVLAVGVWTLVEKSDYISLLNSSLYSASAYILIAAGAIVIVTGIIGCCATLKEMKSLLIVLDEDLKQNLQMTMQQRYRQPGEDSVTEAVDKLQQEFKCCGSNSSSDWTGSVYIQDEDNERLIPDSCCKTPSDHCGRRDHPSNIYKVEGGCIMKLEEFILSQLYILGAVGIGIAFLQLVGMMFTCCLYRSLKEDPY
ncbi:CD151 antigen isoform X3 [Halichoeres trimaculatus]|uniref:CD151 antigen isoform X3 n=1 Tax=Halichoeres trimaculatus TaxID=147232 RepID=UPI003D9DB9D4